MNILEQVMVKDVPVDVGFQPCKDCPMTKEVMSAVCTAQLRKVVEWLNRPQTDEEKKELPFLGGAVTPWIKHARLEDLAAALKEVEGK